MTGSEAVAAKLSRPICIVVAPVMRLPKDGCAKAGFVSFGSGSVVVVFGLAMIVRTSPSPSVFVQSIHNKYFSLVL